MWLKKIFKIQDPAYLNAISRAGTIGLHLVSAIVVGAIIGYFLDQWLETRPWFTIIFLVSGIIAGFKNVYIDSKRLIADQEREEQKKR